MAIIGANGAGKSTVLRTVVACSRPSPAAEIVRAGISLVSEGRRLFQPLSVEENLLIGGNRRLGRGYWTLLRVYALFSALQNRRHFPSHALSGGEQQMAAIGRALMANPRALLCDEISLGLSPLIVRSSFAALPRIKASGTGIILVEQDIVQALEAANRVYCFQEGLMSIEGRPDALTRDQIHLAYFGQ